MHDIADDADLTGGRRYCGRRLVLRASVKPDVGDTGSVISEMEDWARAMTPEVHVKRSSNVSRGIHDGVDGGGGGYGGVHGKGVSCRCVQPSNMESLLLPA